MVAAAVAAMARVPGPGKVEAAGEATPAAGKTPLGGGGGGEEKDNGGRREGTN